MRLNLLAPAGLRAACLLTALIPCTAGFAQGPGFSKARQGEGYEEPSGAEASVRPQQVGQPATDLQGINASGSALRLSQFKGKVILLDVSAMWCGFCQEDAPAVQYLYRTYGPKGLAVVTCLAEDNNGAEVTEAGLKQWVSTYNLTQQVMNDQSGTSGGAAERAYVGATGGFPTLALIDRNFNVQYLQGGLDQAAVTARIQTLLAR
jgi:thiol-disulfide isomerase/thioredoxin